MRMFFQAKVWKQTSTRRMNPITSTWEIHRAKDNVLFSMHLSSWSEKMEILKKILFQLCTCQVLVWEDRCNKQQAKEYFSYCAPVKLVWQMQTQRATDPKVTFANCTELDLRPWMPEKKWGGWSNFLHFWPCQDVLWRGPPSNLSFMAPSLFLGGEFWRPGFPLTSRWSAAGGGEGWDRWAAPSWG